MCIGLHHLSAYPLSYCVCVYAYSLSYSVCVINDYYICKQDCKYTRTILYVYVFREYCLQLIMYSVSAQGVVERIINVR